MLFKGLLLTSPGMLQLQSASEREQQLFKKKLHFSRHAATVEPLREEGVAL